MPFRTPTKAIVSASDLAAFQSSDTHADVVAFITTLSQSILNTPLSASPAPSPAVASLLDILVSVEQLVSVHPPTDHGTSRFGNPAFRPFLDDVRSHSAGWLAAIPGVPQEAVGELKGYFDECWGNRERIDYGSGMELNFICLLWVLLLSLTLPLHSTTDVLFSLDRLCLSKLKVFGAADQQALVLKAFWG